MTETFAEKIARWNADAAANAQPPDPEDICRHGLYWEDCDYCRQEQAADDVGGWSWLCTHGREGCPECAVPPRPDPIS